MAITKEEFTKVNQRRIDLITKQHSGFTEEESSRPYDSQPGWREECERRYEANLTTDEHHELAECTKLVDEYINEHYPPPTKQLEELIAKLERKK